MATSLALSVLFGAVFLYVLFLVVRAAVEEGVQQALRLELPGRPDLRDPLRDDRDPAGP